MQGFQPVTLSWKGQKYTVPAESQLRLIAAVEDALAGASGQQAINVLLRREGPPYSRLAAAFGAALRYAGADVSDEDVYLSMMDSMAKGADVVIETQAAVMALLSILSPPIGHKINEEAAAPEKQTPAAED
jgi:hypothetical protein